MNRLLEPRLRGVFHQYAFFLAVGAGAVLVALSDGHLERFAVWVYAAGLAAMFGASALYHRVRWRTAAARALARRLDHAMIFVFIAATYTPFALLELDGAIRVVVLGVVWSGAVLGLVLDLVWIDGPKTLAAAAFVALGWVGVIALPQLVQAVGVAPATLLLTGGALYSLGALTYATSWPNPFPGVVEFHEVFHLLVVVAAATQFVALSLVVL